MPRAFLYNIEALTNAINRDNATLLNTYDKVTKRTRVHFNCNCGEEHNKLCLELVSRAGAFCKKCTLKHSIQKTQKTLEKEKELICTLETLHSALSRDKAELSITYDIITINTLIKFKCNCGEESEKNCLQLIKVSGAFCKSCTRKSWTQRIKHTNMERYGVECTVHAAHIKKQIKENNLEKYGVENVFQSEEVKEKIKQSCLEIYGVEHVSQSQEIKKKLNKHALKDMVTKLH